MPVTLRYVTRRCPCCCSIPDHFTLVVVPLPRSPTLITFALHRTTTTRRSVIPPVRFGDFVPVARFYVLRWCICSHLYVTVVVYPFDPVVPVTFTLHVTFLRCRLISLLIFTHVATYVPHSLSHTVLFFVLLITLRCPDFDRSVRCRYFAIPLPATYTHSFTFTVGASFTTLPILIYTGRFSPRYTPTFTYLLRSIYLLRYLDFTFVDSRCDSHVLCELTVRLPFRFVAILHLPLDAPLFDTTPFRLQLSLRYLFAVFVILHVVTFTTPRFRCVLLLEFRVICCSPPRYTFCSIYRPRFAFGW